MLILFFGGPIFKFARLAILGVMGMTMALSLWTVINSRMALGFAAAFAQTENEVIGSIKLLEGKSDRRSEGDDLWLPLGLPSQIHSGDLFSIDDQSTLLFQLKNDLELKVAAGSKIRLRYWNDRPLIRLYHGSIEVRSKTDQTVYIQSVSVIEEVTFNTGTSLITNNSTDGLSIVSAKEYAKLEKRKKKAKEQMAPSPKKENAAQDPSKPEPPASEQKLAEEEEEEEPLEPLPITFDLPYPREGTLFLVKSLRSIIVAGQITCPDLCKLEIKRNGSVLRKIQFKKGQDAVMRVSREELKFGEYEWSYETETLQHKAAFSVKPFLDSELSQAISKGQHVEIL